MLDNESLAYDATLKDRGHFIAAQALEPVSLRTAHSRKTHEQIGGFILIEAKDLNEAIQLASKIPRHSIGGRRSSAGEGTDR